MDQLIIQTHELARMPRSGHYGDLSFSLISHEYGGRSSQGPSNSGTLDNVGVAIPNNTDNDIHMTCSITTHRLTVAVAGTEYCPQLSVPFLTLQ